jgi:hypothetical protein
MLFAFFSGCSICECMGTSCRDPSFLYVSHARAPRLNSSDSSGGRRNGLPVRCKRWQPVVLSIPLSDETGRPLGLFTILAGVCF